MNKKIVLFLLCFTTNIFSQTLDQLLPSFQNIKAPQISQQQSGTSLIDLNKPGLLGSFPDGISSLFTVPELIEEMNLGYLTVYIPKGYGRNVYHYGIWNAIPFVIFDNSSLELRMGLIFEHRQVGFIPDEWISTSLSGENLPELEFLIPRAKNFLNFSHNSSQWRSTVLLTDSQLKQLKQYAESPEELFTLKHRFIDSSSRPYLIGLRHKSFFQVMLLLYDHIAQLPQIKKFNSSDLFPEGAFFEELTIGTVVEEEEVEEVVIEEVEVEPEPEPEDEPEYEYGYEEYITEEQVQGDAGYTYVYEEYTDETTENSDVDGDYAEGDYDEGDYAEGDYAEGDYAEGDYAYEE